MYRYSLAGLVILATIVQSAPIPKSLKKKSTGTIIGTWRVADSTTETWIFREDGTAGYGDSPTNFSGKAVFTYDETVTPNELNWSQDDNKTIYQAIYVFEDGLLKINFSSPGKERVKNITDQGGARQVSFRRLE